MCGRLIDEASEKIIGTYLKKSITIHLFCSYFTQVPEVNDILSVNKEAIPAHSAVVEPLNSWVGGETVGMQRLVKRLEIEKRSFVRGRFLPNISCPNMIHMSTSLSPYLRHGCLSVRLFYWCIKDLFQRVKGRNSGSHPTSNYLVGQLIWREYFYTMSVNNPFFTEMDRNPICLNIRWSDPNYEHLHRWKHGQTGFPLIDAAMRQLLSEGWIHHILRNIVASFLTRGALWHSWELGLDHFLQHLLDADLSVCAGNWMWVSSSAFEKLLDTSSCVCPVFMSKRFDPNGIYIKRFVPELKAYPVSLM